MSLHCQFMPFLKEWPLVNFILFLPFNLFTIFTKENWDKRTLFIIKWTFLFRPPNPTWWSMEAFWGCCHSWMCNSLLCKISFNDKVIKKLTDWTAKNDIFRLATTWCERAWKCVRLWLTWLHWASSLQLASPSALSWLWTLIQIQVRYFSRILKRLTLQLERHSS